ncbi:MAG: nicotinate-nucleotide adenylyltransferase [Niameybacter sp.]|uniref:nicotinate-nucleotide adenylyltransferase n=1 Tax=Niameybacter sp. TaxID=2033640 RepID=UPI002FCB4470
MKIAIMGGTFDPIHMGHLVTAEAVRHEFDIDEVLFVPTGNPPHKASMGITSAEHRYLMTVLATAANAHFNVSRIEIDREGTTYTVDTLKELSRMYGPDTKLYFITGADAVHEILNWKNSEELLQLCTFVAVTRPGYQKQQLLDHVENLRAQYHSSIKFLEVPALAISSSDIRKRVKDDSPIKYLVTSAVENYICKHNLYRHPVSFNQELVSKMSHYVKEHLSTGRYEHTKGVVEMSIELANCHNVDADKVFIAALFHDLAKELSIEEGLGLCDKYQIPIDGFERSHPHLIHGKVGALLLERDWGVTDLSILNSVRYHTIGRPHMTDIEKIIYLADMVERGRKPYPALDQIRRLAKHDLNKAMYTALSKTKEYVQSKVGQEMHPITDVLLDEYKTYDV